MPKNEQENPEELDEAKRAVEDAKKTVQEREEQADDLASRFRQLRARNNFRVMLEEIFNG